MSATKLPRDLPTELIDGEWQTPRHGIVPSAVITYAEEPSPETGHVGWCWWANGRMGEAATYEEARSKAEEAILRGISMGPLKGQRHGYRGM